MSKIPKRHARRKGDFEDGFAVLGAFNLAGRTALVSGAEPDTVHAVASALWEAGAHVFASDAPVARLLEAAPP